MGKPGDPIKAVQEVAEAVGKVADQGGKTARAFSGKEQATKRQSIDMLSDNKLSKSIRPLTIIWLLTLFTACLVADWLGLETGDKFQDLITWALLLVLGFYFPGRDIVKTLTKKLK